MENTIYVDFKSLRQAYIEVKTFIEYEVGSNVSSLNTKIEDDLGCAGDDNYDLLDKFVSKYELDYADFDYSKHFLSEGEITSPLLTLLTLPILVIMLIICILTFGKINLFKVKLISSWQRQTLDMTFGDMLTWYLTRKYCLRADARFKLMNRSN
ncbi:DUF1493 family protein [Dyadobacter sediminis]|uniref:DUF1493 family protein n=1 Tax=Dyadobacter sediminis TaxID=1493691 RepID=A0A5R9KML5_9BACT|nr:DUF1493 family protein [Dyadobacter sediminis]TLU97464.1 DUF1493 family protein [Dyadobacter sediminis]GGC16091.1 hypothetical protein GCM10011325_48620 [Dyadobacter sediminis]